MAVGCLQALSTTTLKNKSPQAHGVRSDGRLEGFEGVFASFCVVHVESSTPHSRIADLSRIYIMIRTAVPGHSHNSQLKTI